MWQSQPLRADPLVPAAEGSGHQSALAVFEQIVAPAARRFGPDMVLVSAGFDAHHADPLATLTFQASTYHALAVHTKALAEELCGQTPPICMQAAGVLQPPALKRSPGLEQATALHLWHAVGGRMRGMTVDRCACRRQAVLCAGGRVQL